MQKVICSNQELNKNNASNYYYYLISSKAHLKLVEQMELEPGSSDF